MTGKILALVVIYLILLFYLNSIIDKAIKAKTQKIMF